MQIIIYICYNRKSQDIYKTYNKYVGQEKLNKFLVEKCNL